MIDVYSLCEVTNWLERPPEIPLVYSNMHIFFLDSLALIKMSYAYMYI